MKSRTRRSLQKEPAQQAQMEKPFFSKAADAAGESVSMPFFQAKLAIGRPGDKYEREADAVANAVVSGNGQAPAVQQKEISPIQRTSLATPVEDEKLGTAEARMEKDKLVQEKPELQRMEGPLSPRLQRAMEPVQMQHDPLSPRLQRAMEEEEPVQMQAQEEEEPLQMQAEEEEEPVQMQHDPLSPRLQRAMEEEEPVQMQAQEEEEPLQMQAEEEEEPVQMQAEEEEEPVQMMSEEEEEVQMMHEEEEEPLQAKSDGAVATRASSGLSGRIESSRGRGGALPKNTRAEMENAFGVDFSGVNIHTGQDSVEMNKELGAQAFTHGQDVYFNSGKFRPENSEGKRLLAHELTHVVQQNGRSNVSIMKMDSARFSGEPAFEEIEGGAITMKKGATGVLVTKMQQALVDLGYDLPRFGVDGKFGDETEAALKKFQKDRTITESGELDEDTFFELDIIYGTRLPYLDRSKRNEETKAGRRKLSEEDKQAVKEAMVPPRGTGGKSTTFVEEVAGENYGDRIKKHLQSEIDALHKDNFADKEPLRADPTANFFEWKALETTAEASKKVTDEVYGTYAKAPKMTHLSGNLIDQWEDEVARNRALNDAEKKQKAYNKVWYLINSNCDTINSEHSAVPSDTKEKAILDPIVDSFVDDKGKVQKLLEIDIGWPGAQLDGKVYLQRFKASGSKGIIMQLWELFHTCIHEYIHTLAHENYLRYARTLDDTRYNTLVEGFCDFFTINVRNTFPVNDALRLKVEGTFYDPSVDVPDIDPGVYPSHEDAERVVSIIGIANAQEAYFRGKTKYIGG